MSAFAFTGHEKRLLGFRDERPEAITALDLSLREAIRLQCLNADVPVPALGRANYNFSIKQDSMTALLTANMRLADAVKIMKNMDHAKGVEMERIARENNKGENLSNIDFPFALIVKTKFIDASTGEDAGEGTKDEDLRMKVFISTTLDGKKQVQLEERTKSRYGFQEDFAKTCLEVVAAANDNLSDPSAKVNRGRKGLNGVERIAEAGTTGIQLWKVRDIVSSALFIKSWPALAIHVANIATAVALSTSFPLLSLAGAAISFPNIMRFCKNVHKNFKNYKKMAENGDRMAKISIMSFFKSISDEFVYTTKKAAKTLNIADVGAESLSDMERIGSICDTGRRIHRTRMESENGKSRFAQRM